MDPEKELLEIFADAMSDVELLAGDDEMGGIFGDIFHAVGAIVHSPITKVVAGAAAFAFPPVGIPTAAGLMVADRALQVAEGMRGTPHQKKIVHAAIEHSVSLAKAGDQDAARFVEHAKAVERLHEANRRRAGQAIRGTLVYRDPHHHGRLRISRHTWAPV